MIKLLRANFHRLLMDKVFWIAVACMAGEAVFLCIVGHHANSNMPLDTIVLSCFGFSGMAIPGVVMAVVCTLFVGKEYAGGTIRNKLIIGKTRESIYFANVITCVVVGLVLELAYLLFGIAIGLPLFGGFTESPEKVMAVLGIGTLLMAFYASVITAITMLARNQTTAIIINLLSVIIVMFVSMYLIDRIDAPEFFMTDEGLVKNSYCPSVMLKNLYRFIINILPTGQSVALTAYTQVARLWEMPIYSTCMIAAVNTAGVLAFKRLDLK